MKAPKVLIIIPAFNESECIAETISAVQSLDVDIIVVNDCSTDTTSEDALRSGVLVINLLENLGIGGAMQTGYKYALEHQYDIAIQFDADGQHNSCYILKLVDALEENQMDLIIGSRYIQRNQKGFKSTFMRRVGSRYFAWLIRILTNNHITDPTSGFRAANKKTISLFAKSYPQDYPEPESLALLCNHGLIFSEILVEMFERQGGKSTIGLLDTVIYMSKATISIVVEILRERNRILL